MNGQNDNSRAPRVGIVFWSGMGNTERMASFIRRGAESYGASVMMKHAAEASPDELAECDAVALGSPAMGCEVVEESEMSAFVKESVRHLAEKPAALFGSYGWGGGEWMRKWADEMRLMGVTLIDGGLIARETPEDGDAEACAELGVRLAKAAAGRAD